MILLVTVIKRRLMLDLAWGLICWLPMLHLYWRSLRPFSSTLGILQMLARTAHASYTQLRTHSDTHMAVKYRGSQVFHALGQRGAEHAHRLQQCARRQCLSSKPCNARLMSVLLWVPCSFLLACAAHLQGGQPWQVQCGGCSMRDAAVDQCRA